MKTLALAATCAVHVPRAGTTAYTLHASRSCAASLVRAPRTTAAATAPPLLSCQHPFGGMHTAAFRANALLTFAGTALAVLAALASVTDLWHKEAPVLDARLIKVERLHALDSGNDEAYLAFSIDADLTSVFSWNTKLLFVYLAAEYATPLNALNQVSLFDRIIESKEDAHFALPFMRNKYKLLDQGRNLRDMSVNLTLYWNVMPIVGRLSTGAHTFPAVRLPAEYQRLHDGAGLRASSGGGADRARHQAANRG